MLHHPLKTLDHHPPHLILIYHKTGFPHPELVILNPVDLALITIQGRVLGWVPRGRLVLREVGIKPPGAAARATVTATHILTPRGRLGKPLSGQPAMPQLSQV